MAALSGIDTIIFDLDGTLLDTIADLATSTNYALSQMGYPVHPVSNIRRFVGNGIRMLVKRAVPEGISDNEYEQTFQIFRDHYVVHCALQTTPYEGIPELLDELAKRGYKLGIVSNKLQPAVTDLARHFFDRHIRVAIGEGPNTRRKPAPDSVLRAMSLLNTTAEHTLYVGDSEVDLQTAANAGTRIVSVSWGFRSREQLLALNPPYLIDHPKELLNLI